MRKSKLRDWRKNDAEGIGRKTQLSISFLSMVERGLTSAAVVSLKKIAEALDMDLSAFFEKTEDEQKNGFVRSYEIGSGTHQAIISIRTFLPVRKNVKWIP